MRSIIDNAKDLRQRTVLMMAYGSGLRVGEVVRLKPKDIESDAPYFNWLFGCQRALLVLPIN